jgi:hypothetical protein
VFERDELNCIYFLQRGKAGMVLPRHQNIKYIDFNIGCTFGISDIVGGCLEEENNFNIEEWIYRKEFLRRHFSVHVAGSIERCELLTLGLAHLEQMSHEFMEPYEGLLSRAVARLKRATKIKLDAIKYCR